MKVRYFVVFAAAQLAGFLLPYFANVHSNVAPLLLGVVLLMPGTLVGFLLGDKASHVNGAVQVLVIIAINALFWFAILQFVAGRLRKNGSKLND
ncbi:MAG TPA: hypothetical protein VIW67_13820 [Terriglobales bacterium]|jgi:cellobiose-specific phosphotransferase system component IIC